MRAEWLCWGKLYNITLHSSPGFTWNCKQTNQKWTPDYSNFKFKLQPYFKFSLIFLFVWWLAEKSEMIGRCNNSNETVSETPHKHLLIKLICFDEWVHKMLLFLYRNLCTLYIFDHCCINWHFVNRSIHQTFYWLSKIVIVKYQRMDEVKYFKSSKYL